LTERQEQEILTRFSESETLEQVARSFEKELHEQIHHLKKAFDAGEFAYKHGLWQLVS
jgi:hypothetical protein